jgi:hypothetical protein
LEVRNTKVADRSIFKLLTAKFQKSIWKVLNEGSYGSNHTFMSRLFIFYLLSFIASCYWNNDKDISLSKKSADQPDSLKIVSDIAPPPGYKRIDVAKGLFGEWLRNISLKKDKQVYLYNGELKKIKEHNLP